MDGESSASYVPNMDKAQQAQMASSKTVGKSRGRLFIRIGIIVIIVGLALFVALYLMKPKATSSKQTSTNTIQKRTLGSNSSVQLTPKQRFLNDITKFLDFNFLSAAEINYSIGGSQSSLTNTNQTGLQLSMVRINNNSKAIISFGRTVEAFYIINSSSFLCVQSSSISNVTCIASSVNNLTILKILNQKESQIAFMANTSLQYTGNMIVAGRRCDNYNVTIQRNNQQFSAALVLFGYNASTSSNSTILNYTSLLIDACLDNQYGYPSILNVSGITYFNSSLSNNTQRLLSFVLKGFSTNPNNAALAPPSSFALTNITISCTTNSVSFGFIALRNSTNTTVLIKNLVTKNLTSQLNTTQSIVTGTGTGSLVFGKSYSIVGKATKPLTGTFYSPSICVSGSCQQSVCFG